VSFVSFKNVFNAQTQLFLDDVGLVLNLAHRYDLWKSRLLAVTNVLHYFEFVVVHLRLCVYLHNNLVFSFVVNCQVDLAETSLAYFLFYHESILQNQLFRVFSFFRHLSHPSSYILLFLCL